MNSGQALGYFLQRTHVSTGWKAPQRGSILQSGVAVKGGCCWTGVLGADDRVAAGVNAHAVSGPVAVAVRAAGGNPATPHPRLSRPHGPGMALNFIKR